MAEKTRCQCSTWQFGETNEIGGNLAKPLLGGGKKPILSEEWKDIVFQFVRKGFGCSRQKGPGLFFIP
jgi:hypothetical protein